MRREFGIIEPAKPEFEPRKLLGVPHNGDRLVVSRFGPNTYEANLSSMRGNYSCLPDYPKITFSPATTFESISAAAFDFGNIAKPEIFDHNWLQSGLLVRAKTGVFANPPQDKNGNYITDEARLRALLEGAEEIEGVQFGENGLGYAPYSAFKTGEQSSETFAKGGLARLLEGARGSVAERLRGISSTDNYKLGVNVWGFDPVEEPVLRVASLFSDGLSDGGRLGVVGDRIDYDDGYAFGVLKQTSEAGSQKSE